MLINRTVFTQLFHQVIKHAIEQSRIDGVDDYELAFYRIERIGFAVGRGYLPMYNIFIIYL